MQPRIAKNSRKKMIGCQRDGAPKAAATATIGVLACSFAPVASAGTDTWSGSIARWAVGTYWSTGAPPNTGDTADLFNAPGVSAASVTFDSATANVSLGNLILDGTSGGSVTLVQSGGNLACNWEEVGNTAAAVLNLTGGNNKPNDLYLAYTISSSSGTVYLSGSASLNVQATEVLAYNGVGVFNQSGGTHTVGGSLFVGANSTSNGIYNLSGGQASIVGSAYWGWTGTHSSATCNLSGTGSLTVSGNEYVGNNGTAVISQADSSTHYVGTALYLGYNSSGHGSYSLSNSAVLNVSGSEFIGYSGTGRFTQTGGTHTIGGSLYLAYNAAASSGTYVLSGSSLLSVTTDEILGYNGKGIFEQSGGTHTIGGQLILGVNTGASATYNLGGAGSLTVGGPEFLGYQGGTGSFNQSGGSHSVTGTLTVASSSQYTLSGGSLAASIVNHGSLTQSGGTLTGSLDNYGAFTFDGGSFNGPLLIESSGTMSAGPGVGTFSTFDLVDAPDDGTLASYIQEHVSSANPAEPALLFYDPTIPANSYLDDQTYALANAGYLSPLVTAVPEPWWIGVVGPLAVPFLLGRRRRRIVSQCK